MPSTRQKTPTAMNVVDTTRMVTRSMSKRWASEQRSATEGTSACVRTLLKGGVPVRPAQASRKHPEKGAFGHGKRKASDMANGCPSSTPQAIGRGPGKRPNSKIQSSGSSRTSTDAERIKKHCDRYGRQRNGSTTRQSAVDASSLTKTGGTDDPTGTSRLTKAQPATTDIEDVGRGLDGFKNRPRSLHFHGLPDAEPYGKQLGGRRARRCLFPRNTPVEGNEHTGEQMPDGKFIHTDVLSSPRPTMTQRRSKGQGGAGDGEGRRREIYDESRASPDKESPPPHYSHLSNSFCVFL